MAVAATTQRGWGRGLELARRGGRQAAEAVERTPLEVLLGGILWVAFSLGLETSTMEAVQPLAVTVGLALPLVYAASILHSAGRLDVRLRWLASGVAVGLAALYGYGVFVPEAVAEGWRLALLVGAAWATLLSVPLLAWPDRARRRARVHAFAARLAGRVAGVGLYAGLLYLGLAGALAAVAALFNVTLPEHAYGHLFAVVFLLLPPWAVAAGLPSLLGPPLPASQGQVGVLRRVGSFLLVPLIAVYMAIVYAYMVRMAVTGEIPNNIVSPVVLGAGGLVLAALLVLEPLREREDAAGFTRLVGMLPPLLLPLAALALWAVLVRLGQYGWTEFRYVRLMAVIGLAAFAVAGTWQAVRRAPPPLPFLPPALALALLLMAVGPWSAPAVSYRDQMARLVALLEQAEGPRTVDAPATLDAASLARATDLARYLGAHHGWDRLAPLTPGGDVAPDDRWSRTRLPAALGLAVAPGDPTVPLDVEARLPAGAAVPGVMAGTLYGLGPALNRESGPPDRSPTGTGPSAARTRTDTASARIIVTFDAGATLTADLAPLLAALAGGSHGAAEQTLAPDLAVVPLRDAEGAIRGQLLLSFVAYTVGGAGEGGESPTRLRHWSGMAVRGSGGAP
jgi:hypothetical protein